MWKVHPLGAKSTRYSKNQVLYTTRQCQEDRMPIFLYNLKSLRSWMTKIFEKCAETFSLIVFVLVDAIFKSLNKR